MPQRNEKPRDDECIIICFRDVGAFNETRYYVIMSPDNPPDEEGRRRIFEILAIAKTITIVTDSCPVTFRELSKLTGYSETQLICAARAARVTIDMAKGTTQWKIMRWITSNKTNG